MPTTQPTDEAVAVGQIVTFSAAASGTPGTVQWQIIVGQNGSLYRTIFTNAVGKSVSDAAQLLLF